MKYIKPHLSPELRAQITPHKRQDLKLTSAGIVFCALSILLIINLWPENEKPLTNNTLAGNFTQSIASSQDKQILGESTAAKPTELTEQFTQYTVKNGDTLFNISQS